MISRGIASLFAWFIAKICAYDTFAGSAPPFNLGGKGKATTFLGGTVSLAIKIMSIAFFTMKLNEMIYFAGGSISQMTI